LIDARADVNLQSNETVCHVWIPFDSEQKLRSKQVLEMSAGKILGNLFDWIFWSFSRQIDESNPRSARLRCWHRFVAITPTASSCWSSEVLKSTWLNLRFVTWDDWASIVCLCLWIPCFKLLSVWQLLFEFPHD
jgi:hypothetical protein